MRTNMPNAAVEHAVDTMCEPVGGAAGERKCEAGIANWAGRVLSGTGKCEAAVRRKNAEGVYVLTAEEVQAGRRLRDQIFVAPDGYIRRSPVQEIVVDPLYRKRIVRRVLLGIFAAAALAMGLYLLVSFKLISL